MIDRGKKSDIDDLQNVWIGLDSLMANVRTIAGFIDRGCNGKEANCAMLVGPTGIGKSSLLDTVLSNERFKPYENAEGTMQPLIRITAPDAPTTKSISQLFLQEQGDPFAEKDVRKHQNILMSRVFNYLRGQKTTLVVIDEAQGFLAQTGSYASSDFIKRLLNEAICPVILSGLSNTLSLLDNEQLGGRCELIIELHPYSWFDAVQQREYRQILKGCQERVLALKAGVQLSSLAVAGGLNYASYGLLRETRQLLQAAIIAADGAPVDVTHLAAAFDGRRHQRRRLGTDNRGNPFKPGFIVPDAWNSAEFTQGQNKKKKAA